MKIKPSGDKGIIIIFGEQIKKEIHYEIMKFIKLLEKERFAFVEEILPSYTAVLVNYNPSMIEYEEIKEKLNLLSDKMEIDISYEPNIIHIPVLYGGEFGPDLEFVAKCNNLTIEEVIKIHSERNYLIYMLGFTPGFPFLGGMSKRITAPRLEEPRTRIASGSVGIAGSQTGIYPIESPGGWRLIGRTPVKLFLPEKENPVVLKMGDYIKFEPIKEKDYFLILKDIEKSKYNLIITKGEKI